MLPSPQLLTNNPKPELSPVVPRENMLCLRDRPEERHFIKMCFPTGKSNSDLCPLSFPDHPLGNIFQFVVGANIFKNGHWFGIGPKAPVHPKTCLNAAFKHSG